MMCNIKNVCPNGGCGLSTARCLCVSAEGNPSESSGAGGIVLICNIKGAKRCPIGHYSGSWPELEADSLSKEGCNTPSLVTEEVDAKQVYLDTPESGETSSSEESRCIYIYIYIYNIKGAERCPIGGAMQYCSACSNYGHSNSDLDRACASAVPSGSREPRLNYVDGETGCSSLRKDIIARAEKQKPGESSVPPGSSDPPAIVCKDKIAEALSNTSIMIGRYCEAAIKYLYTINIEHGEQCATMHVDSITRVNCSGNRLTPHPRGIVGITHRVIRCCHYCCRRHHCGWSRTEGCVVNRIASALLMIQKSLILYHSGDIVREFARSLYVEFY